MTDIDAFYFIKQFGTHQISPNAAGTVLKKYRNRLPQEYEKALVHTLSAVHIRRIELLHICKYGLLFDEHDELQLSNLLDNAIRNVKKIAMPVFYNACGKTGYDEDMEEVRPIVTLACFTYLNMVIRTDIAKGRRQPHITAPLKANIEALLAKTNPEYTENQANTSLINDIMFDCLKKTAHLETLDCFTDQQWQEVILPAIEQHLPSNKKSDGDNT